MQLRRSEGNTTLYRHFNENGILLYVGISLKWTSRTKEHHRRSPWWRDVANITLQHFDTLKEARAAEKIAIDQEKPVHNKMRDFKAQKLPPPRHSLLWYPEPIIQDIL